MENLVEVAVDGRNESYKIVDGSLYTMDGKTLMWGKNDAEVIDIPEGVETIANMACSGCWNLASVKFPDTVKTMETNAFFGCPFESIELPSGLKTLEYGVFSACANLERITVPGGVNCIDEDCFIDCENLREVKICEGVQSIKKGAFARSGLERIEIPASVREIDVRAFSEAERLREIVADEKSHDFASRDGSLYHMPDNVLVCARKDVSAFTIPKGTTAIGDEAFAGCKNLESITVPGCVKKIGSYAFRDCSALKDINIKYGVWEICEGASSGTALKRINIPSTMNMLHPTAFIGAEHMEYVDIDPKNRRYTFADGGVYNDSGYVLLACVTRGASAFKVADRTGMIGCRAFKGCKNLREVIMPRSVDYFDREAFAECPSLVSMTLPPKFEVLNEGAFYRCKNLRSVTIPASALYVELNAFADCPSLEEVVFEDPTDWVYQDSRKRAHDIDPAVVSDIFALCELLNKVHKGLIIKKKFLSPEGIELKDDDD